MAVQPGAMERRASQFDVARKRAAETEQANLQQSREAVNRRLSQSGGGPGGVAIKLDQQAEDASARRLASANEGITAQEAADNERKAEIEAGRTFAREERLGSQGFQSGENALSRRFATSERLGSQDFGAGQAALERGSREKLAGDQLSLQKEGLAHQIGMDQNRLLQDQQKMDLARQQFAHQVGMDQNQLLQFEKQFGMAMQQFEQQKYVDQFNMELATKMFEEKDMLERLMTGNPLSAEGNPALGQWTDVFKSFGIGG